HPEHRIDGGLSAGPVHGGLLRQQGLCERVHRGALVRAARDRRHRHRELPGCDRHRVRDRGRQRSNAAVPRPRGPRSRGCQARLSGHDGGPADGGARAQEQARGSALAGQPALRGARDRGFAQPDAGGQWCAQGGAQVSATGCCCGGGRGQSVSSDGPARRRPVGTTTDGRTESAEARADMKASSLLIALATVGHAVTYLVAAPPHVMDASWPPHARFHVLQALLWALGFNVLVLVVVARAYGRGERWSWWALATAWLFLHVAYFACLPAVPG